MRIAYYDESGDDGFPSYSSPLFVLTGVYLHYMNWKDTYTTIHNFRCRLREEFGLPVKWEIHTTHLLLNKKPYGALRLPAIKRVRIIDLCCELIASLDLKIVNVVIVKPRIQKNDYKILDTALTYSVQRIENDLKPSSHPENQFVIITDEGRVGKMRKTTRRIQRYNPIPSKFAPTAYRQEIQSLIEDPLPKDSKESYFIQLADLVTYIVYLYAVTETGVGTFAKRMPEEVTPEKAASAAAPSDHHLRRIRAFSGSIITLA
jgi:hypothetical protein